MWVHLKHKHKTWWFLLRGYFELATPVQGACGGKVCDAVRVKVVSIDETQAILVKMKVFACRPLSELHLFKMHGGVTSATARLQKVLIDKTWTHL